MAREYTVKITKELFVVDPNGIPTGDGSGTLGDAPIVSNLLDSDFVTIVENGVAKRITFGDVKRLALQNVITTG